MWEWGVRVLGVWLGGMLRLLELARARASTDSPRQPADSVLPLLPLQSLNSNFSARPHTRTPHATRPHALALALVLGCPHTLAVPAAPHRTLTASWPAQSVPIAILIHNARREREKKPDTPDNTHTTITSHPITTPASFYRPALEVGFGIFRRARTKLLEIDPLLQSVICYSVIDPGYLFVLSVVTKTITTLLRANLSCGSWDLPTGTEARARARVLAIITMQQEWVGGNAEVGGD